MTQYYQKLLQPILKLYLDIFLLYSTVIMLSIIFAHLFRSLFSTGEYLKLVLMIWVIYPPLFTILYYRIAILKKSKRLSAKILDNGKQIILKLIFISLIIISLSAVYQSYYVSAYFAPVMGSAKPNLLEGDYLMVDRFRIKNDNPLRGQVIGFKTSRMDFDLITKKPGWSRIGKTI